MAQTLEKTRFRFDASPASKEITDLFLQAFKLPSRNGALHLNERKEWKERIEQLDARVEMIVSRHFARFLVEEGKFQDEDLHVSGS